MSNFLYINHKITSYIKNQYARAFPRDCGLPSVLRPKVWWTNSVTPTGGMKVWSTVPGGVRDSVHD